MMAAAETISTLLFREALHLDRKEWDAWLALFAPNAVFWVPAWLNEDTPTHDPDTQTSLIYHDSRYGLEERVARIRSRKSVTAMPLPRTAHTVTNVLVVSNEADRIEATASFTVNIFDPRTARARVHFGQYDVTAAPHGGTYLIERKKILLLNDRVATTLDFYDV
jgi:benzoate/toluate 1,2-dioxygenase beta subunit/2,4,5-trichlorophenoxyacetic acid oxygenase 2